MLLSVLIPVYNGSKTIESLVDVLKETLKDFDYEIILIDDGSQDNSRLVCEQLAINNSEVKFIGLRKNFGEFNAVMAGLNHISGQYVVMIDDDFQNPPSQILKLLNTAQSGDFDVVYSQYEQKKHHFFRNVGSWLTNRIATRLLKKPQDLYLSSFKMLKNDIVQEIVQYQGTEPYIDGIIFQLTQNVGKATVEHRTREDGISGYTFSKLLRLFLSTIFGYSVIPLSIIFWLGFVLLGGSLLAFFFVESTHFLLLFMGAIQLISVGILGQYIGQNHQVISRKPQFSITKKIGFD
jgi:glycosyltransferase involved in cell wall biosynthesis